MELCDLCQESSDRSHVVTFTDKKGRVEVNGCSRCINILWDKIQQIKNRDKMTNEQELKLLGLDMSKFKYRKFGN